jgi:hypothetical protein
VREPVTAPAKIKLTLSPQAERYVRRDAPVDVRRLAARGALPLPPIEIATVLFALTHDPDGEVKARARQSLEGLPPTVADAVLGGEAHPAVLGYLAHAWKDDGARIEKIALNPATDDRTIVFLASLPHKRVVEIVANNQMRLLRCAEIAEALGENPATSRATIDRILSFLGFQKHSGEPVEEGDREAPVSPDALTDESAAAALRAFLGDDASGFAAGLIEEREGDGELDPEEQGNLFAMIQKMSIMQKIKLARMGNKEARGLLVRDRNKLVASAAIRSPKVTENEVEAFAKARNVSDDVLRIIASNPEWTRNYPVKVNLSTNPKCPLPMAVKFLNFLHERELRQIMKSKDVPSGVSTHARRLLQKKGKI